MSAEVKSYDRRLGETEKAYSAFVVYMNLGVERSLAGTAMLFYGAATTQRNRHPNIRQVQKWAEDHQWQLRVLDYDRDIHISNREFLFKVERERYLARGDELKAKVEAAGFGILTTSLRILATLDRIASKLENLPDKEIEDYTSRELDLVIQLPTSIRSIATCMSSGEDLAADGLALTDVIDKMAQSVKK
jgi:hypothetical protein